MSNPVHDTVYVLVDDVVKTSDKGICCSANGKEFWVPRSQIRDDSQVTDKGDKGTLAIPRWLAEEKEVEYTE